MLTPGTCHDEKRELGQWLVSLISYELAAKSCQATESRLNYITWVSELLMHASSLHVAQALWSCSYIYDCMEWLYNVFMLTVSYMSLCMQDLQYLLGHYMASLGCLMHSHRHLSGFLLCINFNVHILIVMCRENLGLMVIIVSLKICNTIKPLSAWANIKPSSLETTGTIIFSFNDIMNIFCVAATSSNKIL